MRKNYITPQAGPVGLMERRPLLNFSVDVLPGEEGNQEQAEAKDNRWGWLWDDEYRFRSLFDEVENSEKGWK